MSDILFRYLLFARRREASWTRRLFLANENLLAAGVEQLVESAAARVAVTSQHERITMESQTVPASRHRSVTFYAVAQPHPPRAAHFETRSERFPLRESLKIRTCPSCNGSGEVRCHVCWGRGTEDCSSCGGSGAITRKDRRRRCPSCGGNGRRTCSRCRGRGEVRCATCAGEGQVAEWQEQVYRWLIEKRLHDEVPPHGKQPVLKTFRQWLNIDLDRVADLKPTTAAEHLGYHTPEAMEVVSQADTQRQRLEQEAQRSTDRYLFHRTEISLTPLGYTVLRWHTEARVFWLVGRGEKALEVAPRGTPDILKWSGWLGLASGGTLAWDGLVSTYHLALPEILHSLGGLAEVSPVWLAAGAATSWLATLSGAHRILHQAPAVRTLAILSTTGRPTCWLPCLAYLGSYTQNLHILDRDYTQHQTHLQGASDPGRQSKSLTVELLDGRRLRLVEVPNFLELSPTQQHCMLQAVDAVLLLDDANHAASSPTQQLAVERISTAPSPPPLTTVTLDEGQPLGAAGTSLPLETIRHTFVTNFHDEVDWNVLYGRLWRPVEGLLAAAATRTKNGARQ